MLPARPHAEDSVITLAGTGTAGNQDGSPSLVSYPVGGAAFLPGSPGILVFSDTNNDQIRQVDIATRMTTKVWTPPGPQCASAPQRAWELCCPSGTHATVPAPCPSVQWPWPGHGDGHATCSRAQCDVAAAAHAPPQFNMSGVPYLTRPKALAADPARNMLFVMAENQ